VPGRPVDGLPIGIQLAAKRGHDAAILATARVLEAGLGRRDVSTDPGALQSVRS
jgi:Asp-tRNA(Asn)/Glu-tRNA(Gln) amidotransferase A subunit family amidase